MSATVVHVWQQLGLWWFEPRDARGRPAWTQRLAWNRHSSGFSSEDKCRRAVEGSYPGLPIVTAKTRKATGRRSRSRR